MGYLRIQYPRHLPVRRLWISMCQVMGGVIGESAVGSGSRDAYHQDKSFVVLKIFGVIASGGVRVWENKKDLNTEGDCRVEFTGDDGGRQLISEV
jgi:hypothetical protein